MDDYDSKIKAARFYVRCNKGVGVAQQLGYKVRWWTLTESNEALNEEVSFSKEWNNLNRQLKHKYGVNQGFCWVEHRQGDMKRRNWHVIQYGNDKIDVNWMREYWKANFLSTVTGMAEIKHPERAAGYLAGYLNDKEKFIKAIFSHNWVFRGWWGFNKFYHEWFGRYLDVWELALMAKCETEEERVQQFEIYGLYKDIKRRGFGVVMAEQNERWKQRQREYTMINKGQRHILKILGEPGVQSEFDFNVGRL
ncbi:hypothetical protein ACFLW1_00095 [Chloroflexota bacterium]